MKFRLYIFICAFGFVAAHGCAHGVNTEKPSSDYDISSNTIPKAFHGKWGLTPSACTDMELLWHSWIGVDAEKFYASESSNILIEAQSFEDNVFRGIYSDDGWMASETPLEISLHLTDDMGALYINGFDDSPYEKCPEDSKS